MDLMEKITSLAKRRGFIYPGSEIYGELRGVMGNALPDIKTLKLDSGEQLFEAESGG